MHGPRVAVYGSAIAASIGEDVGPPSGDSVPHGRRGCELAIERGKRILSELEKPQHASQKKVPHSAPPIDAFASLDASDSLPQTPDERTAQLGEGGMLTFYEFFAGGGMARAGLGNRWQCVFANDFDEMKAATYRENWGNDHLVCRDVATLNIAELPGTVDLSWASFPCQDLSLAGDYRGLGQAASLIKTRSGTFWPFWSLMRQLVLAERAPRLIVLEKRLRRLDLSPRPRLCGYMLGPLGLGIPVRCRRN